MTDLRKLLIEARERIINVEDKRHDLNIDLLRRIDAALAEKVETELDIALNVKHKDCHKATDAFWQYWRENGVTHKHGYYESTWGAINQALRHVGVVPHDYGKPRIEVKGTTYLVDCIRATPAPADQDRERLDWLEDCAKCYWVTVQTQPSADHIYAGQGAGLREAIDRARSAK